MKQLKYCDQNTAKKVIEAVVLYLVPMSILLYVPRVQLQVEWMVLFIAPVVYGAVTMPLIRYILWRCMPWLQRHERGQILLCCTGHAHTLVGYPILRSIYGEHSLPLCATWDLSGIFVAYINTYVVAAIYARSESESKNTDMCATTTSVPDLLVRAASQHSIGVPLDPVLHGHGPRHLPDVGFQEAADADRASPEDVSGMPDDHSVSTCASAATPRERIMDDLETESGVSLKEVQVKFAATDEGPGPSRRTVAVGASLLISRIIVRVAKMPVAISFVVALGMRSFGSTTDDFPQVLGNVVRKSAACTQILTIFGLGLFFQPHLLLQRKHARHLAVVLGFKYGFGLLAALSTWMAMRNFEIMIPMVLAIALVMPTPPVVIAYADEYGYDVSFAALVVNASLVLSFVVAFALAIVLPFLR